VYKKEVGMTKITLEEARLIFLLYARYRAATSRGFMGACGQSCSDRVRYALIEFAR
jgi:hypothetical protein